MANFTMVMVQVGRFAIMVFRYGAHASAPAYTGCDPIGQVHLVLIHVGVLLAGFCHRPLAQNWLGNIVLLAPCFHYCRGHGRSTLDSGHAGRRANCGDAGLLQPWWRGDNPDSRASSNYGWG